jgi:hypothetical protein
MYNNVSFPLEPKLYDGNKNKISIWLYTMLKKDA